MKLFQKKTKWIPLTGYHNNGTDYFLQARKSENGFIEFSVSRVSPQFACSFLHTTFGLKLEEQFQKLINEVV